MICLLPTLRVAALSLLSFVLLAPATTQAQSTAGYGDWQLHLPNSRARVMADAGKRIYVAAEDAFFYFDKETNTTTLLSRRDGLNSVGVSTVAYDATTDQVLVAYRDGNLDLLSADGTRIRNINDIKRKQLTGSKNINHITFNGRYAYLSCDFGLVVLDMTKMEVRDTFSNIGPQGAQIKAYASTVASGFLFLATDKGILRAPLTADQANYRNWNLDLPGSDGVYRTLVTHNGQAYAGRSFGNVQRYVAGTGWQFLFAVYADLYLNLASSSEGLLITSATGSTRTVAVLANAGNTLTPLTTVANAPNPQAALRDRDGNLYIADGQRGLLRTTDRQNYEAFATNAPQEATAFGLLADARTNTVNIFTGGYEEASNQRGNNKGFYEYKDGRWTNYTRENFPSTTQLPDMRDLIRGTRTADGTLYVCSYGDGLLRWKGPGEFKQYIEGMPGVPLVSSVQGDPRYTRVMDAVAAPNGDVWVATRRYERPGPGLFVLTPSTDTWRTIPFQELSNLNRLVLDDFGAVWVSKFRKEGGSTGAGLFAYDDVSKAAPLYFTESNGLPSNTIYALAKDRKGAIWAGTAKGVGVLDDPGSAFVAGSNPAFTTPIVRRGEGIGFAALADDIVKAVAVDGANRKWFGTERGLWLFSENADEGLLHFTTDNSPLPSNSIIDIAVNDKTGEVFVATAAGVVSYRGSATVTEGAPKDCFKVSPNPVRTNFNGQVGITGLANNGVVKITDVTGKLVYQTTATGGGLVWNLSDYNGRKVQSGVYLVLSSDADGKNGCVSKIAVVEK
ncbi:T9SS type A sorting domain-containing protein [Hymenobacter sp. BT186]|uniref:T9SS type A sorting domain-containing protein n=1 Tax=Hymenobacter telluris TaxID=2816474 RepID=A0A939ETX2_9BACT|nr:two-component regulator propeller domain-containing protein [Hymenobacter telluris]MBO0357734.1 T9SS type A sorting domain-containing protein [Hymenobacter telluris]MBW3373761.1 T9SS type A sorting domain-containing protein [Hymenobacter norwichensis]